MPQEFHVLRCYSCETFQVHIVKKSNKWSCKMCGENQSLKKIYGQGSGKDCRKHVQALNEKRMINDLNQIESIVNEPDNDETEVTESGHSAKSKFEPKPSKWCEYLTEENQLPEPETDSSSPFTFERPNKRKKKEQQSIEKKNKDDSENNKNINKNDDQEDTGNCNSDITKNVQTTQKSKWSSFVTESDEDSVNNINTSSSVSNIFKFTDMNSLDDDYENNKKVNKNDDQVDTGNCNSGITKNVQTTQKSKWSSFVTKSDEDSVNNINTSSSVSNIFNFTDINSLDDILDL